MFVRSYKPARRCSLESLERRQLFASIVVTSTANTVNPGDGVTTLREAINLANATPAEADSIVLASGATYTIDGVDNSTFGANGLPSITTDITVEGNGATIARSSSAGMPAFRLFYVAGSGSATPGPTGTLTLKNLTLTNGLSKGSGGEPGGGGGAGMGGAVFNNGLLNLNGVLAVGNTAKGGYGGIRSSAVGDGGVLGTAGEGGGGAGGTNGENGAFGAGGGKASTGKGGNGGFGGGGGSTGSSLDGNRGLGGFAGGRGNGAGGGGAGLGGAIFNGGADTAVAIVNSTLTANTAVGGSGHQAGKGYGGAVFSRDGEVVFVNSTVSSNTAEDGRGVYLVGNIRGASLHASNSIIGQADNSIPDIAGNANINGSDNLVRRADGFLPSDFSYSNADPRLAPLANNGGLSRTMALLNGSPAIDSGFNDRVGPSTTSDQRGPGFPRIKGASVDVGAFESEGLSHPSSFSVSDASVQEGDSGQRELVFTVTRSGDWSTRAEVRGQTQDDTAVEQQDYIPLLADFNFEPGQASSQSRVQIKGDTTVEPDETLRFVLSRAQGAAIADGEGVGTIVNDDGTAPPSQPRIDIVQQVVVDEGDTGTTPAVFTVTLEKVWDEPVTVNYATRHGPTEGGADESDYTPTSGTLTFAPGQTSKQISVAVKNDTAPERDFETFFVDLSSPVNGTLGNAQGNGVIKDNDAFPEPPRLSISDAATAEGNSGTKQLVFVFSLDRTSESNVIVNYNTRNVTAGEGDYGPTSGQLTFTPGQTSKNVAVTIKGDTKVEGDEQFILETTGGGNFVSDDGQALGLILNDDGTTGLPSIAINNASTTEGDSGVKLLNFNVTLSQSSTQPVTVAYRTRNQSAGEGDYSVTSGQLTFAAGQTSRTIGITIKGDTKLETDETFAIDLSNAVNATIGDNLGIGILLNDD